MHGQGFVHRDIKSANLLVMDSKSSSLVVKLTDFGLSTKIESFEQGHKLYLGTPEYMAPEITVQEGSPVFESGDHSTLPYVSFPVDVWSIGIVTYELITGHLLYS
jgi:myosin-light-chain kinase